MSVPLAYRLYEQQAENGALSYLREREMEILGREGDLFQPFASRFFLLLLPGLAPC